MRQVRMRSISGDSPEQSGGKRRKTENCGANGRRQRGTSGKPAGNHRGRRRVGGGIGRIGLRNGETGGNPAEKPEDFGESGGSGTVAAAGAAGGDEQSLLGAIPFLLRDAQNFQ